MRLRPIAAVAALAIAGGTLTACSTEYQATEGCVPSHDTSAATDQITVSGEFGGIPTVDFDGPISTSPEGIRFAEAGEGHRAEVGDLVFAHFTVFDGTSGEQVFTSLEGEQSLRVSVGDSDSVLLESAALCAAAGSRVVATSTLEGALGEGQSLRGSDLGPQAPVVMVYDVTDVMPGRATGTPQPGNADLPAVSIGEHGQPGLSFTGADAPENLVVHTSMRGDGAEVVPGDTVVLQYTGVIWETGEVFDSTWQSASPQAMPDAQGSNPAIFQLQEGALIDGFYNGLIGQNVGSQVVISIPQDQGYSDPMTRPASIGEGDTLVFVVDILGTL